MTPAAGALHHVLFFLDTAPVDSGSPCNAGVTPKQTSQDTIGPCTKSENSIDNGKVATTPPKLQSEGADSVIDTPKDASSEPDLPPLQSGNDSTTSVASDDIFAAMIPSLVAAGQFPYGGRQREGKPSGSDDKTTAQDVLANATGTLKAASAHFAADSQTECTVAALECAAAANNAWERVTATGRASTRLCANDGEQTATEDTAAKAHSWNSQGSTTAAATRSDEQSVPEFDAQPPVLALSKTMTTAKANPVESSASSPSKTTPLSVSAPAFVPFGPPLPPPPAPAITAAATAQRKIKKYGKAVPSEPIAPLFEQRKTAEKGIGLYAVTKISVGTRLICEAPLVRIRSNDISLVINAYQKLPQHKKEIYDRLHAYTPKNINLEQELLHIYGVIDDNKKLANHLKVMSIFSANDFLLADQSALGVFETVSRINHSCIPNVHFSNNAELGGRETVHAARDIEAGEELLANYIGGRANYQPAVQRREYLSQHYGFVCQCDACSGVNPVSDACRETLHSIVWGLNEYKYQDGTTLELYGGNPFYPACRKSALAQAEDAISLLLSEKLVTSELAKAYRFASDFALGLRQYEKALHYAFYEGNIERNIFGKEVGDLKALGLSSEQWITSIQFRMDENGIRMPGEKFWAKFPEKKALWYELRKVGKKRAAEEKELELGKQTADDLKRIKNAEKSAKRKIRDREMREAAQNVKQREEPQKMQDQGEDKENVKDVEAVGGISE